MKSGFAVIGDTQLLPGCYCAVGVSPGGVAEPAEPGKAPDLFNMSLIGDAVEQVCRPIRVNYSIYGNRDPFLHAHIFPRYDWEPEELKMHPVWRYPDEKWTGTGDTNTMRRNTASWQKGGRKPC